MATDASGLLETLLSRRERYFSLEQPFYTSQAILDFERETVFRDNWLFAGLECEVREPGAFITLDVLGSSVLVIRGRDGEVRAFFNSCRHRGSIVCDAERGRRNRLVCPYHHWTYDTAGKLVRVPKMHDGFEPEGLDLRPVSLRIAAGVMFVCLGETAPDFERFHAALTPALGPHDIAGGKLAAELHWDEAANWKLVMENSRECDHCQAGHPEIMKTLLLFDISDPWADPTISGFWRACEAAGLPSQTVDGPGFRVGRLPLTRDSVSITPDGRAAVAKPLAPFGVANPGSLRFTFHPSVFAHAYADYAVFFRLLPTGPLTTRVTAKFVVAADAEEGRDYDLETLTRVWRVTNDEDKVFCERNQRGVNSVGYRPGPYARDSEYGVWGFVEWYAAQCERGLKGPERRLRAVG